MTPDQPNAELPQKGPYRKTPPATPAVQAWLDGEAERNGLTDADEQETAEFWTRINAETERLRRRSTPIHVQQKILASLPEEPAGSAPRAGRRSISLNTTMAVVIGVVVLAVGALIGALLMGR